jgi:peroxiredoxin
VRTRTATLPLALLACLALVPRALRADEPAPPTPSPSAAWRDFQSDPTRRNEITARAKAYLAEWEAAKKETEPKDLWAYGMLLNAVQRTSDAAAQFKKAAASEALAKPQRLASAVAYAGAMLQASNAGTLTGEPLAAATKDVEAFVALTEGAARANLLNTLGYLLKAAGEKQRAIATWVAGAEAANDRAFQMADHVADLLSEDLHTFEQYERAQKELAPVLAKLKGLQEAALVAARKLRDEEKDNAMKSRRDQSFRSVERGLEQFAELDKALRALGSPAPEWTLVKAYGPRKRLADFKGKVVVLDFWATWCPWCIKSFPALRDLLRDYAGKDLAVVGVTTSSSNVWDQRYVLDDDLKAKAGGAAGGKPVLTRPRAPTPSADGIDGDPAASGDYDRSLEEYRTKEQEIIAQFIANHEMTWDVVQIDEKEPAPKYLLGGWPHCVVIDREGRIRHFHSGALLREKPKDVLAFRAILDALLAEPAPVSPAPAK